MFLLMSWITKGARAVGRAVRSIFGNHRTHRISSSLTTQSAGSHSETSMVSTFCELSIIRSTRTSGRIIIPRVFTSTQQNSVINWAAVVQLLQQIIAMLSNRNSGNLNSINSSAQSNTGTSSLSQRPLFLGFLLGLFSGRAQHSTSTTS